MSSTNKTTNYNLSQFIGSDKPAWLVDYNGDMSAIDTQMKANADAVASAQTTANTANSKADTNASAISTLDSQINGASGVAADVVAVQSVVNTINSLIGNGEPTTTDKTLIGAINELDSDVSAVNTKLANSSIEMAGLALNVTADGVKTFKQLLEELAAAFKASCAALPSGEFYTHLTVLPGVAFGFMSSQNETERFNSTYNGYQQTLSNVLVDGSHAWVRSCLFGDTSSMHQAIFDGTNWTLATDDFEVVADGTVFSLYADHYKTY